VRGDPKPGPTFPVAACPAGGERRERRAQCYAVTARWRQCPTGVSPARSRRVGPAPASAVLLRDGGGTSSGKKMLEVFVLAE